jgi:hypothetical protein
MSKKINAKYLMSFDDFVNRIDNIKNIEIPKNYIMIEHGHTKKESKKSQTRDSK